MAEYPRPIESCNAGDGSPLVLGDENQIGDMHSPNDPTSTVHVVDWNGDGEPELVCSGNEIYVYRFIDALSDGTPIVDRGMQWGEVSRALHRNERDKGLVGTIAVVADFDGDQAFLESGNIVAANSVLFNDCLLYTSPSPRDRG